MQTVFNTAILFWIILNIDFVQVTPLMAPVALSSRVQAICDTKTKNRLSYPDS